MLSQYLSELVFQVIETLPPQAAEQLAAALDRLAETEQEWGAGNTGFEPLFKISENFPNSASRYQIDRLFDGWREAKLQDPGLSLRQLSAALGILNLNRTKNQNRQKIEVVWTGPSSKIPVRQTRQVLSQLISGARKELLIVSFVVFQIPEILELLKHALLRGVRITCVLESPEESGGRITFQGFADFNAEVLQQIKILVWTKEKRPVSANGKIGTLHAKVAVADQIISFISSANLTVNAMTLNMEMGLLVREEKVAKEIVEHFEQLILNKILTIKSPTT